MFYIDTVFATLKRSRCCCCQSHNMSHCFPTSQCILSFMCQAFVYIWVQRYVSEPFKGAKQCSLFNLREIREIRDQKRVQMWQFHILIKGYYYFHSLAKSMQSILRQFLFVWFLILPTKSMRSLRFFSICCGGRRLIKSRAQSSC